MPPISKRARQGLSASVSVREIRSPADGSDLTLSKINTKTPCGEHQSTNDNPRRQTTSISGSRRGRRPRCGSVLWRASLSSASRRLPARALNREQCDVFDSQ